MFASEDQKQHGAWGKQTVVLQEKGVELRGVSGRRCEKRSEAEREGSGGRRKTLRNA